MEQDSPINAACPVTSYVEEAATADNGNGRKPGLLAGLLTLRYKGVHIPRNPTVRGTKPSCKSILEDNPSWPGPSEVGLWGVAIVSTAEKTWLKLACFPNHSHFGLSKCYQPFRKPLGRIQQIKPKVPTFSVHPGLFSPEGNETSSNQEGGGSVQAGFLQFPTPHALSFPLLSITLKKYLLETLSFVSATSVGSVGYSYVLG